jgi:hypothetical protein
MSAGGFLGMIQNIVIISIPMIAVGFVIEKLVTIINVFSNLPMDMFNGINMIVLIFKAGGILSILIIGLNYIVVSNSESTAEV